MAEFGRRLVRATHVELSGRPVVDVADRAALARLATLHDTVVVQTATDIGQAYVVSADSTVYRYTEPADGGLGNGGLDEDAEGSSATRTVTADR